MKNFFKIGLFGAGVWSHKLINLIRFNKNTRLLFICKRFKTSDHEINNLAAKYKIPLHSFKDINSKKAIEKIKKYDCDIFLSMSYDQIFKKGIISLPRQKIINCHAGHLPKYRGRNVINWAIINGETKFYITIHYINERIDTGPILLRKKFNISKKDTYQSVLKKAEKHCPNLLFNVAKKILNGSKLKKIYQSKNNPNTRYYFKRIRGDEVINFNAKSKQIHNFIRALSHPKLYAILMIKNNRYKIISSKLLNTKLNSIESKIIPGVILETKKNFFDVKSQDNKIRLFFKKTQI